MTPDNQFTPQQKSLILDALEIAGGIGLIQAPEVSARTIIGLFSLLPKDIREQLERDLFGESQPAPVCPVNMRGRRMKPKSEEDTPCLR
ncbi:MAG: hypothetical protein Q8O00_08660 [Holophaga sp.]|nr:hypothetical protein [Holophaga sp.]